jgi:hypothetical protein
MISIATVSLVEQAKRLLIIFSLVQPSLGAPSTRDAKSLIALIIPTVQ